MAVDPTGSDLKRFLGEDPGGPVVMLNLPRYRDGGEAGDRASTDALREYLPGIGAAVPQATVARERISIMSPGWSDEELERIEHAQELRITAERDDGRPPRGVPIWVVTTHGQVYVRTCAARHMCPRGQALVRGLAVELAPIRVNAVRAGAFRTPLWELVPEPQRAAVFAGLAQRTLTGTVGEPEQIAAAHLYLMQNPYVTGTVQTVDGGLLLAGG